MSELILVGGPNGAGKTTFIESFLDSAKYTYLGADQIAYELCPENVESVAVEAGRIFVKRIGAFREEGRNLIVESTLSGRSLVRHVERYRESGYRIRMVFISLPNATVSADRVRIRVEKGGHRVPLEDIERRFLKTHQNFWHLYRPLADRWYIFRNQQEGHHLIAAGQGDCYVTYDKKAFRDVLWKSME